MSKVFLGVGHGGSDSGAVKYLIEKDVNLNMALACRDYLKANGVEVKMSRTKDENDTLTEEIIECNKYNPDLAVDIHNNAGGGDGFEAFYTVGGGKGKTLAQNIETEIKKIGQNSRGIKTKPNSYGRDYFGFIREIKCPAVITEGVFVDNKADSAQADTLEEQKTFGEAIAKGILKTLGINSNNTSVTKKTYTGTFPILPKRGYFYYDVKNKKVVDKGEQVKNLQRFLNWAIDAKLTIDGSLGPACHSAILKYQKTYSLTQDGYFGPACLAKAKSINK